MMTTLDAMQQYYTDYGRVPDVQEIVDTFHMNYETVLRDVEAFVKDEIILKIKGRFYFNHQKLQQAPSHTVETSRNWPITIIRAAMVVVSIGSLYMSIYYSYQWLIEFLTPFRSGVLAIIMVLYLALSVQVSGLLLQRRQWVYMGAVVSTAIVVFVFSVISTIAGQYNATAAVEEEQVSFQISTIDTQIEDVRLRMEQKNREIAVLQNLLEEFDSLEVRTERWTYYITTRNDLQRLNDEFEELRSELNTRIEEQRDTVQEAGAQAAQVGSFYQFLSELTGGTVWVVRFLLSIAPALFIDIVGPIALAIALFLKGEEA